MTHVNAHFYQNAKSERDPSLNKALLGKQKNALLPAPQKHPSSTMGYADFDLHSRICTVSVYFKQIIFHSLVSPHGKIAHNWMLNQFPWHVPRPTPGLPRHNCGRGELHQQSKGVLPLTRSFTGTCLPVERRWLAGLLKYG